MESDHLRALDKLKRGGNPPLNSTTDWDFLKESDWTPWAQWGLWNWVLVSPPTSLWIDPSPAGGDKYALCNLPASLNLKNGRLITYHGRALAGLGQTFIYLGVTGPGSITAKVVIVSPAWSWKLTRITWHQGINPSYDPATIVIRETWLDPNWIPDPTIYYPPMLGSVNRIGLGCTPQALGRTNYFDDTYLYSLI